MLFDAARRLGEHVADLRAYLLLLARVRKDRIGLGVRSAAFQIATLAVLGIFGLCALATAAWLLMQGLVGALGALLGAPAWVGSLIVGLGLPLALVAGILLVKRRAERRQLAELQREYLELERLRREAQARRPPASGPEPSP